MVCAIIVILKITEKGNNMKKRIFAIFLSALMLFAGCAKEEETDNIKVVATLFPQYDFVREIGKDKVQVELMLPPGADSHSYEPTPKEIMEIANSDIFVYTGNDMEPWISKIINGIGKDKLNILDVSEGVNLILDEHKEHNHNKDPHIWTSPVNAIKMCENIVDGLIKADEKNKDFYLNNFHEYKVKLEKLDKDFKNTVENGKRKKIVFGGKFALNYFVKEYGISVVSAYENCQDNSEPGARQMADIVNIIKEENIPVIYYEELSNPKVSRTLSEETGVEILLFHSCHNLSKDDFISGKTYLDIMNDNLINLKRGLM